MTKRNRGKQPNDDKLFAPRWRPVFKKAADDFCYLLSRGYTDNSVAQIVGNRYKLNKRQRDAIRRISSSDLEVATRQAKCCLAADLKNSRVEIDGFNLLILLESALSGGYIFKARDGTYRDISSVHGSYKRVQKTDEAIILVGNTLKKLGVKSVKWYFDQPVSNSGKLKTRLLEISRKHEFNWEVELVFDPDKVLAKSDSIIITADGWIIDNVTQWYNLSAHLIDHHFEFENIIAV